MGADEAVAFARAQIGKPYAWATAGPDTFDCSGLTYAACKAGGVSIGRTTYQQILNGTEVGRSDLMPGDLVFPDAGHVQIYSGNNMVIESPHTGAFVRETQLWGFWRARRVFDPSTSTASIVDELNAAYPTAPASVLTDVIGKIPVLGTLERIATTLDTPAFWRRIGVAVLGVLVLILALAFVNRGRIEAAARNTAKVAEVAAI